MATQTTEPEVTIPSASTTTLPDNAHPEKPADAAKSVTVIFNPVSGQGNPEERKKQIEAALAEHGYGCQHIETTPEQGARYHAEQALRDKPDLIAVSGGDGTVMEVLTATVGTGVPVAIFPAGTGNLLSINLGLSKEVPRAVHAALFGQKRAVDLAHIKSIDGANSKDSERYFAILAGAGYDAWVIRDADREAKNRMGLGAYLWAAVKNLKRHAVRADIRLDDGRKTIHTRAKSIMIANMGRVQGNVEFVPDSSPDDGVLEVAILKAENFGDWCRLTVNALRRRLRDDPSVQFYKAHKIEVVLGKPQPMQFDGEESAGRHRSFTIEVVPGAVEIMVP